MATGVDIDAETAGFVVVVVGGLLRVSIYLPTVEASADRLASLADITGAVIHPVVGAA